MFYKMPAVELFDLFVILRDNSSSNKALSIKALDPLKRENLTILLKPFLVGNESGMMNFP